MMRFVVHHHTGVADHYDLMIESGDTLLTWRIAEADLAPLLCGERISAEKIGDHRRAYLDYEGPVSCNRGRVSCFDRGDYRRIDSNGNTTTIALSGARFSGIMSIQNDANAVSFLCFTQQRREK